MSVFEVLSRGLLLLLIVEVAACPSKPSEQSLSRKEENLATDSAPADAARSAPKVAKQDPPAQNSASPDLSVKVADGGSEPPKNDAGAHDAKTPTDGGADAGEGDTADEGVELFNKSQTGNVVTIDEKGRFKVLADVSVSLICKGEKSSDSNSNTQSCSSTLKVTRAKKAETETVAERDNKIDGIDFEAVAGNHESLDLSLFTVIPESSATLIVVRHQKTEGDEDFTETATETYYAIQGNDLVEVLSLDAVRGESSEMKRTSEKAETTLELGQKHAGGSFVLEATTETTVQKGTRAPKVKSSKTSYVWVPEELRFAACDKLTGKANGVGCGRRCKSGEEFCYGRCEKLDTVKNCGACGRNCGAGQTCCAGSCSDLDEARHCGSCDNNCARLDGKGTRGLCADKKEKLCGIACQGRHYDLDGNVQNGCEAEGKDSDHSDAKTALAREAMGCGDGAHDVISGELFSDARAHNPSPPAFVSTVGAAPLFFSVEGRGGWFCFNDYEFTIKTEGGASGACYALTVITDRGSQTVAVPGQGRVMLQKGRGAYGTGSTLRLKLEKTCSLPSVGSLRYSIDYHL